MKKKWENQLTLLSNVEQIPNAAELSWALTTYREARNIRLMSGTVYARTSSVTSKNDRVIIGAFGITGLFVRAVWDEGRGAGTGVVSIRKFD